MKFKVECDFLGFRHPVFETLQKIEDIVKNNCLVLIPKTGLRKIWATKRRSRKS